jgi:hypothetical protein
LQGIEILAGNIAGDHVAGGEQGLTVGGLQRGLCSAGDGVERRGRQQCWRETEQAQQDRRRWNPGKGKMLVLRIPF